MDTKTLVRRTIIEMALRRQRPGSGSSREFLMRRTTNMQFPDLGPVLGEIPWAVVGAAATRMYMPERATDDLDAMIRASDAPVASAQLATAGYARLGALTIGGSSWRSPQGFSIDLIECAEPWCDQAISEARSNRDAQGLPVLPLPYLVMMKLRASRAHDFGDISRMLGGASDDELARVREAFTAWMPADSEDLESLITLGRLEFEG